MSESTLESPRPRARRRRLRLFLLLAVLLLLVAYTGLDWWSGRQLEIELARMDSAYGEWRGQPVSPQVPAADNRARLVRAAAALLISESVEESRRLLAFGNLSDTDVVPPELRAVVDRNGEAIRLATTLGTRQQSSWEVDADGNNGVPFLDVRALSNALYLKAMLELEAQRADEAVRMVNAGLAVASSLNQERQLIAQLIRIAVADRQFMAIQRVLSQSNPSGTALEDLAHWLTENRTTDPMRVGLEAELSYGSAVFARAEAGRSPLGGNPPPWIGLLSRAGRPFVRLAHTRFLHSMDRLLTVQAGPRPRPEGSLFEDVAPWHLIDRFARTAVPGLERAIESGDDFLSQLGACEIAVALRRYKLDHGNYPDSLPAVVPAYLNRLPINPYTGKVPEYSREGGGFRMVAPRGPTYSQHKRPLAEWKTER